MRVIGLSTRGLRQLRTRYYPNIAKFREASQAKTEFMCSAGTEHWRNSAWSAGMQSAGLMVTQWRPRSRGILRYWQWVQNADREAASLRAAAGTKKRSLASSRLGIGLPKSAAGALRNPLESGLITSSELATRPDQHQGAIRKIKRRSPNSTIAWALRPISASLWHRPTANANPSGAPD